jgi:hypothetical protein
LIPDTAQVTPAAALADHFVGVGTGLVEELRFAYRIRVDARAGVPGNVSGAISDCAQANRDGRDCLAKSMLNSSLTKADA